MSIRLEFDSDDDHDITNGISSSNNSNNSNSSHHSNKLGICDIADSKNDDIIQVSTKTTSKRITISWDIDEQSLCMARANRRNHDLSVITATIHKDGIEFKIELCTIGWKNSQPGYCAWYLTIPNASQYANGNDLVARYSVSVGDIVRASSIRADFNLGVGFPNFCKQDALIRYLKNHKNSNIKSITFNIDFEVYSMSSETKDTILNNKDFSSFSDFAFDSISMKTHLMSQLVTKMWINKEYADITLKCRNNEHIKAHKVILCTASPILKTMFNHKFLEHSTHEIDMTHWDTMVVKSFIKFMYQGSIDIPTNYIKNNHNNNTNNNNSSNENNNSNTNENTKDNDIAMNDITNNSNNTHECDNIDNDNDSDNDNNNDNDEDVKSVCCNDYNMQARTKLTRANNNSNNNNKCRNKHKTLLDFIFELFQMAEFYHITPLIQACCVKLYENIDVNNAFTLLARMDKLQLGNEIEKIREKIWEFILEHAKNVPKQKIFEHPGLIAEMIERLAASKHPHSGKDIN